MNTHRIMFLSVLLILFLSQLTFAGNFKIYPTRIFLDAKQKSDTLQIRSGSDKAITLQLKAMRWDQDENGKAVYTPTKDLVFFPQIFKIEPEEERIIRIGYRTPPGKEESAFRLFVEELPEPGVAAENSLQIVLKMSVPVFIAPAMKGVKQAEIAGVAMQNDSLALSVRNTGSSHVFVENILPVGKDKNNQEIAFAEQRGWYLLSGKTAVYPLGINPAKCNELKELKVSIASDSIKQERQLPIDAEICQN